MISITGGTWRALCDRVKPLRIAVFVIEQGVPEALEWDEDDDGGFHVAALDQTGTTVGCARVVRGDHIGRMAVSMSRRHQGIGRDLLAFCEAHILREGHPAAILHAQTHAIGFYATSGYDVVSDVFMDAGIPHVTMKKPLIPREDKPRHQGLS
jgi:predicted GNAT family N-acyltransferase